MKTIADPLYGSIQLRPVEAEIIQTSTFQRLQNVKQLGQANLIFPGANYSRFSHSIGALRNAGKLIQALKTNNPELATEIESVEPKYRLAALMHDIGHFPFSHASEVALKQLKNEMASSTYTGETYEVIANHETFGQLIICNSTEIVDVLKKEGFNPADVSAAFASNNPENGINLKQVISSELDCDRLDYLKRTSHFTGLPYGNVDIDYLISNTFYKDGHICFGSKAKKSIDHMLIARFHDYQQVVFHKRLIPLEWSLIECIKLAANKNDLDVSQPNLLARIESGDIRGFDDNEVITAIKKLEGHYSKPHYANTTNAYHIRAVLYGASAIQVYSAQQYLHGSDKTTHSNTRSQIQQVVDQFCDEKGIEPTNLHVWAKEHYISKVSPSLICSEDPLDSIPNYEELVFINDKAEVKPLPLINMPDSIVRIIAEQNLSDIRVFILPIENHEEYAKDLALRISGHI